MQAGGTADIARMHDEVIERHQSLKVECARISRNKNANGPYARLEGRIERQ
jgi:hypothetical protein